MSIEFIYYMTDIAATAFEMLCLCILLEVMVPYRNHEFKLLGIYSVAGLLVFIMTLLNTPIPLKILILCVYITCVYWKVFSIRMSITANCTILYHLCSLTGETVGVLLFQIFHLDPFTTINGVSYGKWYTYIVLHAFSLAVMCLVKKWLRPFIKVISNRPIVLPAVGAAILMILIEIVYLMLPGTDQSSEVLIVIFVTLSILCVGLFLYIYAEKFGDAERRQEEEKLKNIMLKQQYAYYQDKTNEEKRIRNLYHDMKNHLLVLQSQTNHGEESKTSILNLQKQMEEYENFYHTGNNFLDVIIRDKAKVARELSIDFNAAVYFEEGDFIDLLDISTIFGNALDNALEASMKVPADKRFITIKAKRIQNMIVISIENSCISYIGTDYKTTKQDSFLHGFGIENIRKAVEKYGGECDIKQQDAVFALKIIIPIP